MNRKAAEFVEENLKTIFAYSLSRVANKESAEDLTNDIVLAILQNADKIKNPDAFYGYVWGIAANTYKKFMRKINRSTFEELDDNLSDKKDFTEDVLLKEDISHLRREIALLSKEYRECTVAYYFDELSCNEVSKKLNISPEMVKYYLFKTRKILKEGISMEREFGEKSFKPTPFEFVTIFSGNANFEYRNLFARKLPGQILMSAYYTPMTVRELAIELGVASVYLEDEIWVLEKYGLIAKTPSNKYQTNLVIFTEDFAREFHKKALQFAVSAMGDIIESAKAKTEKLRNLNSFCKNLSDERLLWGVIWPIMRSGNRKFNENHPELDEKAKLYEGATGINYGTDNGDSHYEFGCNAFAGFAGLNKDYFASAADFGVLPDKNRFFDLDRKPFIEKLNKMVKGEIPAEFMILSESEEQMMFDILSEEADMMSELYAFLFRLSCDLMNSHAPENVGKQIERIVFQTLVFRTVGLLGFCVTESGKLSVPDFDGPVAIYIRENSKEAEASWVKDRQTK